MSFKVGDRVRFKTKEEFQLEFPEYCGFNENGDLICVGVTYNVSFDMLKFCGRYGTIKSFHKSPIGNIYYKVQFDGDVCENGFNYSEEMLTSLEFRINKLHISAYRHCIELEDSGILKEYFENKDNIRLYFEEVSS